MSVKESASSLKVSFSAPLVTHGSPVTAYLVEWWDTTVPVAPEVVELSLFGASSGAFRVSYNGSRTDYLPVTISADGLRNALQVSDDGEHKHTNNDSGTLHYTNP